MTNHTSGFGKKDSLHLAAAIQMGCEIFLTTDDGILKKRKLVEKIRILNPIKFYGNTDD